MLRKSDIVSLPILPAVDVIFRKSSPLETERWPAEGHPPRVGLTVRENELETSTDTSDREIQSVQFDTTGRVLVAKDGYGKVLERIGLVELAAAADDRRAKMANRKARTNP